MSAQNVASLLLPGAVTDNLTFMPVIVETSTSSGKSLRTTSSRLCLVPENAAPEVGDDNINRFLVDTSLPGYKVSTACAKGAVIQGGPSIPSL